MWIVKTQQKEPMKPGNLIDIIERSQARRALREERELNNFHAVIGGAVGRAGVLVGVFLVLFCASELAAQTQNAMASIANILVLNRIHRSGKGGSRFGPHFNARTLPPAYILAGTAFPRPASSV